MSDSGRSTWYVEVNRKDNRLYLYRNGQRLKAEGSSELIGCVTQVRKFSRDGVDYLVVRCTKRAIDTIATAFERVNDVYNFVNFRTTVPYFLK